MTEVQATTDDLKAGWTRVAFGDVVKNANLTERDPETAGIDRIVGLEHLDPENLHVWRWNTLESGTSFSRKFVPGQTLFGKRRAYQRKVAFAEFEGICSGDILTFEPKDPDVLLPELLPFICQTDAFFDHALGTSAGSLSPRTSWKALQDFEFLLPPIEEQKRIAEILWVADQAVVSLENAVSDFGVFMRCEVERRLNSLDCGELALPKVLSGSPRSGCSAIPSPDETGHWVLSLAALSADGYCTNNLKPVKKTSKMMNARLHSGDLLISRSNTAELVGLAGIFDEDREDVSFPDTMMRLPVNTELALPEYLELVLLSTRGRKHMMKTASGTSSSMKKINRRTLSEFRFPVPTIAFQADMVAQFSDYKARHESIAWHLQSARNLLSILTNDKIEIAHV